MYYVLAFIVLLRRVKFSVCVRERARNEAVFFPYKTDTEIC